MGEKGRHMKSIFPFDVLRDTHYLYAASKSACWSVPTELDVADKCNVQQNQKSSIARCIFIVNLYKTVPGKEMLNICSLGTMNLLSDVKGILFH